MFTAQVILCVVVCVSTGLFTIVFLIHLILLWQFNLAHIATGDLLRAEVAAGTEAGKLAHDYMQKGQLVPNDIVVVVLNFSRKISYTICYQLIGIL